MGGDVSVCVYTREGWGGMGLDKHPQQTSSTLIASSSFFRHPSFFPQFAILRL